MTLSETSHDYARIAKIIQYLEQNYLEQPELETIAKEAHMSMFHFQRLFTRWAGISPKRFLQFLTKEHAKKILDQSKDILSVSYESGLSSPGRLHDLILTWEAMTPGEYKSHGEGMEIRYGLHPTRFGPCFIAMTSRGVCGLSFSDNIRKSLQEYQTRWPGAKFIEDQKIARKTIEMAFEKGKGNLNLILKGTPFQIKVWEALIRIPFGSAATYEDVSQWIQSPKAMRAVGTAVSHNPIAYLIPCHRVIRKMGILGEYRWGSERKKAILGYEFSRQEVA